MISSEWPRRIASHGLLTDRGWLRNPLVEIGPDGTILSVATCEHPDREPYTEFYAGMLLPGLVDAHCHLELSYLRGAIPPGGGFAAFARAMGEVRDRATEEERLRAVAAADAELTRQGVAAVGDIANGESACAVKEQSRIAYRTFAEVFGLNTRTAERQQPLLRHPRTSLTPHSLYSVQDELFLSICREGEAPLSIHFLESPAEKELFRRSGPLWEWYGRSGMSCDFLHYGSPAERLVRSVPRDRSVVLVHACMTEQEDIDRIMNHFTAPVYWCLCPRSNRYISDLRPPVDLLRRNGLRICIGTDSLASNESLSMLDELRCLPEIPLDERLRWATAEGAAALGFGDRLGSVEPGKRPGLTLLSGIDYGRMQLTDRSALTRIV